ncbi:hypothetical protein E2C01_101215 [Portunus trituberculatus]|uniref:Uncharacterized protein n=1 Tax=Portunus trituberculatus TaxID=210409 RepID=A0A5B7KJJ9_PORTR|nr:hypothetical protein [Portunus trituberculatus]
MCSLFISRAPRFVSTRLVFPIALTVGLFATVMRFVVTGPLKFIWDNILYVYCQDYWWRDMIFVDNLYFGDRVVSVGGGGGGGSIGVMTNRFLEAQIFSCFSFINLQITMEIFIYIHLMFFFNIIIFSS